MLTRVFWVHVKIAKYKNLTFNIEGHLMFTKLSTPTYSNFQKNNFIFISLTCALRVNVNIFQLNLF
jgi:hypothetical protein